MLIKLTHYDTGKPVLVDIKDIKRAHRIFDMGIGTHNTKITTQDNSILNVTETLKELMDIQKRVKNGTYEVKDWDDDDANVDETLKKSYVRKNSQAYMLGTPKRFSKY